MMSKASFLILLLAPVSALVYTQAATGQTINNPNQVQQLQQGSAQLQASIATGQARASQLLAAHQQAWQQAQQQLAAAQAAKAQQLLKSIGAPTTPGLQTRGIAATTTTTTIRQPITTPIQGPVTGPAAPAAVISALNVTEGQPGDPVLITGNNFGNFQGEVHFVVNPGMDLVAPMLGWTDTQVLVTVPKASGILRYVGAVYVLGPGVPPYRYRAGPLQFIFDPQLDEQVVKVSNFLQDKNLAAPSSDCFTSTWGCPLNPYGFCYTPIPNCTASHPVHGDPALGTAQAGADEYYFYTTLKNGWIFESSDIVMFSGPPASLGPRGSRPQSSPYVEVHWTTAGQDLDCDYLLTITIKGPLGTSPF